MTRISLIIAIVAALAVGVLNFVKVKEKIDTLITERNDWHGKYDTTFKDLTSTKKTLAATEKDLKQTKETLEATTAERDKAMAEAAAQSTRATDLADKLAKTSSTLKDTQQKLERYTGTGVTPEQILAFNKVIKDTQDALEVANEEKKVLSRQLDITKEKLAQLVEPDHIVRLPEKATGKVLAVDPKWDFVVLDFGENKGVLENGELLVHRNGTLVGKVRIQSIQKNRCIANVMPEAKLGEVLEGDQVIPAYPKS